MPSHFFVPDPEIFPQLEGLKLEADDKLIYVSKLTPIPLQMTQNTPWSAYS
jgi:hypothetical protein